jgi:transposase, IS5 family
LSNDLQLSGWREYKSIFLTLKRTYNKLSKMRYSNSKKEEVQNRRKIIIHTQIKHYLALVERILSKAEIFNERINDVNINKNIEYGKLFIDQVNRRIFKDEKIPSQEKVYSIFEPYTEWICKGKAGVRQELGLKICIVEDQCGFILNHRVMKNEQDKDVAFEMVNKSKQLFPCLRSVSFDKGFHSKSDNEGKNNLINIEEQLHIRAYLPKKGKRNKIEQKRESSKEFIKARKQHPAVESAINALETHGLDRCPDKGEIHYKRYVAMAITSSNLHKLGSILIGKELGLITKRSA